MQRSESSTRPIEIEKFARTRELWMRRNIIEVEKEAEDGSHYTAYEYDEAMCHTTDPLEVIQAHPDTFWAMCNDEYAYTNVEDYLRARRQDECFVVVDRPLWLDSLEPEKLEEIKAWRVLWLDVTNSLEIPAKPEWL